MRFRNINTGHFCFTSDRDLPQMRYGTDARAVSLPWEGGGEDGLGGRG